MFDGFRESKSGEMNTGWDLVFHMLWKRYTMTNVLADQVPKNAKFPREAICMGCEKPFQQKSRRHWSCTEKCRWKKALRMNTQAALNARQREREWYKSHRIEHIAAVSARRKAKKCQSL
jgi:hypothetical protein